MTTYSTIASTEVDSDSPVTDTLMGKVVNNPIAIAEGSAGAPFLSAGWHNYDGAQALTAFYDFGIHGALATVVSPDFADGWEYLFFFDVVTTSAGGSTDDFRLELYRATSAAYATASTINTDASSATVHGQLAVLAPRHVASSHRVERLMRDGAPGNSESFDTEALSATLDIEIGAITHTTAQKLLRARFSWVSGNINGGKIFMARRQVGFTR
jgi:hypothetical protein